jgi:hypothetical protein
VSIARLELEQLLLAEERLAAEERAALHAVPAQPPVHRKRVPHRTKHVLVLGKDPRSVCARYLLDWWRRRTAFGKQKPVTTNEINRLAAILRRLET